VADDSRLGGLGAKHALLNPYLNERQRRLVAAADARFLGHGGIATVARATGLSRTTLHKAVRELEGDEVPPERVRKAGGGRKSKARQDPGLTKALEQLVDPATRGDPMSPLRWSSKSTAKLAEELCRQGYTISARTVADMLKDQDYSLQANRKTREGSSHPDRDAQFQYINEQTKAFQQRAAPVVSVDAKKKELVGDYKNGGREWQPKGSPVKVQVHDFPDKKKGKTTPHGVYDLTGNEGWVSVGTDHDTAEFAVQTIRCWWRQMGSKAYPEARELLIMADGGGSNGSRTRLWKLALQRLADETGIAVSVCHFPPGTSKWNKIEHRMFSYITKNWRGKPLESHEVIVNLIGNTTTKTGLRIQTALDSQIYPTGIEVSDEVMERLNIERSEFHGEWNYRILPKLN
jgi:Rhodopirellula transposase DDE domain